MAFNPRGLVPYKHLSGKGDPTTRRYPTRGENLKPIFKNDVVTFASAIGGVVVESYTVAIDGTAAAAAPLGVVNAIYDANGKPLTFSQPNKGPYLDSATVGFIDVIVDPNQTYLAFVNGTASAGMVGKYAAIDVTALGSAYGISGHGIGVATTVNATRIPVTGDQYPEDGQWAVQIIGWAKFENDVDLDVLASAQEKEPGAMEVKFTAPLFGAGAGRVYGRLVR